MAGERIFKVTNGVLTEIAQRDPARKYKYRAHPSIPAELIYLELDAAEESKRMIEEQEHANEVAKGPQPTVEDRIRDLEARLAAVEKGKP